MFNSINKGQITVPKGNFLQDGTLFIFDDVSALGISYPKELIEVLKDNNQPTCLVDAQNLAREVAPLIPLKERITVLDGGGILTYLFLKRNGYAGEIGEVVRVSRDYSNGGPECKLESPLRFTPNMLIDDIVASGQTIRKVVDSIKENPLELVCLMASSNLPKGGEGYRIREGSTISGVDKLYCSKFVNGRTIESGGNLKPAILSLRYLISKALDNKDYSNNYLSKKFGGIEKSKEIVSLLEKVDREPINLLRRSWKDFLKMYGVK